MEQYLIKIVRHSANGSLRVYKVELDGFQVGKLESRSELNIPTCIGQHTLSFIWMGKTEKTIQINIQEGQYLTIINSKLNMWSGKIELELVNNYQEKSEPIIQKSENTYTVAVQSSKRKKHIVPMVVIIIAFIWVVFIVAIVNSSSNNNTTPDITYMETFDDIETVEIPDITGLEYDAAITQLEKIDIDVTVKYTYNSLRTYCNNAKEIVVNQSLQGKVEKGNHMILVVSKPAIIIDGIILEINSVGGVDTRINYINNSDKQIAYVYFEVKYYDRMGYPSYCSIKKTFEANLKCTGPINAQESKTGYWDAVVYNSATAAVQPQTIKVIFTDGTSQIITNKGVYWHTESYYGGELHN